MHDSTSCRDSRAHARAAMPTLLETFPCAPATIRGRGVLLGGHAGRDVVLYANGNAVVIRSLADPLVGGKYSMGFAVRV